MDLMTRRHYAGASDDLRARRKQWRVNTACYVVLIPFIVGMVTWSLWCTAISVVVAFWMAETAWRARLPDNSREVWEIERQNAAIDRYIRSGGEDGWDGH